MSGLYEKCVLHYKMNDNAATTTVIDSMGNYNGTAQRNTSLMATTGKIGGALDFDGTTDYINVGDSLQSVFQSDFSVSLWVKPTEGQPEEGVEEGDIFGVDDAIANGSDIEIWHYTFWHPSYGDLGVLATTYKSDGKGFGVSTGTTSAFNAGQETWHHIVWNTKQTSPTVVTGYLYLDKVLRGSNSKSGCVMADYVGEKELYIGAHNLTGAIIPFYGPIDDVMVFNDALTQEEIIFLYNGGFGTEHLDYPHNPINETWGF